MQNDITIIRDIAYTGEGNNVLQLDLYLPAATTPLPVILGVPGGGWRNCSKEDVPRFLTSYGFAMACLNYRVSSEALAPANIQDCKAAVRWLRAQAPRYGIDPQRIGVYGASAGGHLAALLGLSTNVAALEADGVTPPYHSEVQAVCAVCGPSDLTRIGIPAHRAKFPVLYEVTEQYLGGQVQTHAELARLVSPLTYVSAAAPPMLHIHGDADSIVPVEESLILYTALQTAGADVTLRTLPGCDHGWFDEMTAEEIAAFFKRTLGA